MAIDPTELKTALDMLDVADPTQWEKNGEPKLEVVQRLMGNTEVTAADVSASIEATRVVKRDANRAAKEAANKEIGATPAVKETGGAPAVNSAMAETDKPDQTGPGGPDDTPTQPDGEEDKATLMAREVVRLTAEREPLLKLVDQLAVQKHTIEDAIVSETKRIDALTAKIEANTVQLSDAEMVKMIQQQTQKRLTAQAEASARVADAMRLTGAKTFASPLDAALAAGTKRSITLVNGQPVVAPHPRSPEGVRNMANWVHHDGAQRTV